MDNLEDRCTEIRVVHTTSSGFMWAFEYRSGKTTSRKKSLMLIEHKLKIFLSRDQQVQVYRPNRADVRTIQFLCTFMDRVSIRCHTTRDLYRLLVGCGIHPRLEQVVSRLCLLQEPK